MLLDNEAGTVTEWSQAGEKIERPILEASARAAD